METRTWEEVAEMSHILSKEGDRLFAELGEHIKNHDDEKYKRTNKKHTLLCGELQALQWVLKFRDKFNND